MVQSSMPEINNLRKANENGWDETGVLVRQLKDAGRAATCNPLRTGLTAIFVLICLFGPISLHSSPTAPPRTDRDSGKISEAFARYVRVTGYEVPDREGDGNDTLIALVTTIADVRLAPAQALARPAASGRRGA